MKNVHLHIQSLPVYTPAGHPIFAAGNFNDWKTGDENFVFIKNGDGSFSLHFETGVKEIEFRINRGDWSVAEGDMNGLPNLTRKVSLTENDCTIPVFISSWIDFANQLHQHSSSQHVHVIDHRFFMPQLNRHRRILAYLPADYWTNDKRYPVLYMHDGQNLFDSYKTLGGEWNVDETMDLLSERMMKEFIVIGIDNGEAKRLDEYAPWKNPEEGGGEGKQYADFIVYTLKPYIDEHFRTLPDHNNTGIMGSSMGGLISLYTAMNYQDVFGMAAVFSPSLWFTDDIFDFVKKDGKKFPVRWMLMAGKKESERMTADMLKMYFTLREAGFREEEIHLELHSDGTHSEWFWSREFLHAVEWMYDAGAVQLDEHCTKSPLTVNYNEVMHQLEIHTDQRIPWPFVEIWQANGKQVIKRNLFYCTNIIKLPYEAEEVLLHFSSGKTEILSNCCQLHADMLMSA